MVASLPITCAAIMATDSGTTGFTLPGMMLLPGCSAGSAISLKPARGPLFIQRKSFDIFIRLTPRTLSWPDSSAAVSWLDIASKKLSLGRNPSPVRPARQLANAAANSGRGVCELPRRADRTWISAERQFLRSDVEPGHGCGTVRPAQGPWREPDENIE